MSGQLEMFDEGLLAELQRIYEVKKLALEAERRKLAKTSGGGKVTELPLPANELKVAYDNTATDSKTTETPKHAPLVKTHNGKVIIFPRREDPAA